MRKFPVEAKLLRSLSDASTVGAKISQFGARARRAQ